MIELQEITKSYRMGEIMMPVLKKVSLCIDSGELIAIMGPSGSGKSTLLHILGLLDQPDGGEYRLFEKHVTRLDDKALAHLRSETIGFVFQQFHLLKRTTALENVRLPLVYKPQNIQSAEAEALLKQVGLSDRMHHRPNELSGGQQQRVAIARALINRPKILMADEPTGNLDSASGRDVMNLFKKLNSEGITVILVTHESSIADYANRIIYIRDGMIQSDEKRKKTLSFHLIEELSETNLEKSNQENLDSKEKERAWIARSFVSQLLIYAQEAVRALLANKMRTILSMLGIIIGVAAVVTMLALGRGAQASVSQQLSGLGSNRLVIRPNAQNIGGVRLQAGSLSRLTFKQADEVRESVAKVKAVAPAVQTRGQAVWGSQNTSTIILGTTPDYVEIYAAHPAYGRFFNLQEMQNRERVALLGLTVVKNLFGDQNPVGEWIKINRISFQVIGVLPAKGATGPQDADDIIVVPLHTAMYRLMGKDFVDLIDIAAENAESVGEVQQNVVQLSKDWPKIPNATTDSYRVDNLASVQEAFTAIARMLGMLLATIAGISLVVGGIGIMNIMLVSVTERTREIGLRKALGASSSDIMNQFLIESVVLCIAGAAFGILLGTVAILITSKLTGWKLGLSFFSVLLSCGFSALIGIGFGLWPAKKAAALNPIEALRHE